ncbi:hypothetical protein DAPPUDRAFT_271090 [Daphnia pulex]|uniref:SWIM-type domain-containing protein n=1 Tax=Daphnia pulex TaxID=6669 RepID=E9I1R9_DAPPU|nr:hypothetical protein DAPPUDRAFT_271090 [Daphnia pulex]|eukprot:EFX62062.1 hypothetical protein DAPPUDRAFT_271090 [Daphnia pulex]
MNHRLPCRHILFLAKENGTNELPVVERWCISAGDDVREDPEEMEIHHSPVAPPRFPGPRSKKQQEQTSNTPSRTTLIKNFNSALTEASEVVQELPMPAIASAIKLVQYFIRRWKVNAPIRLSEESNKENEEPGKRKRSEERDCASEDVTSSESPPKKKILRESAYSNDGVENPKAGPSVEAHPTQPLAMETTQQPSSKGKALKTVPSNSTAIAKPQSKLPQRKRGPGRAAKSIVLSKLLLGGSDTANKVLQDSSLVTEEMVVAFPDHLSTAILEEEIGDLERFREYFDDDAWLCVTSLVEQKKDLVKKKKSNITENAARKTVFVLVQKSKQRNS